jgi:hypothetical protein
MIVTVVALKQGGSVITPTTSKKVAANVEYLRRQGIHCSSARGKCPIENILLKL